MLGYVALAYRGAYCASKYAIEGLTDALRLELRGTNIHVAIVEPGPIKAKFRDNAYAAFKAYVDSAHSAHREQYETMIARLEGQRGPLPFTLPPEAVLKRVVHALESKHPHRRYQVDGAGVSDGVAATAAADAMARLAAPSHRRRWTPLTPRPHRRYQVTVPAYASAALKRLLPPPSTRLGAGLGRRARETISHSFFVLFCAPAAGNAHCNNLARITNRHKHRELKPDATGAGCLSDSPPKAHPFF